MKTYPVAILGANGTVGQKIIALPLLLILTWLFYKKYNKNIKDNCWFAFYTAGHAALLTLPLIPLWYLAQKEGKKTT